jgi:hypothetical protein
MDEVTQAELVRRLEVIEKNVERRHYDYVSKEVYQRDILEIRTDIAEIKKSQEWMMRLLVTQFFGMVVAVIVFVATRGI